MTNTLENAVTLLKGKHTVAARPLLHQFIAEHPQDVEAKFWLGVCDQFDGKLDSAEHCFQEVLKLQPHYDKALYALGLVREQRGDIRGAVSAWRTAYNRNPDNQSAIRKLKEHGSFLPLAQRRQAETRHMHHQTLRQKGVARRKTMTSLPKPTMPKQSQAAVRAPRQLTLTIRLEPLYFFAKASQVVTVWDNESLSRLMFMAIVRLVPYYFYKINHLDRKTLLSRACFYNDRRFTYLPRGGTLREAKVRNGDVLSIRTLLPDLQKH